jgi:hypothetical protein
MQYNMLHNNLHWTYFLSFMHMPTIENRLYWIKEMQYNEEYALDGNSKQIG